MSLFLDRADAGRRLARALAGYKDMHPVILALPRGGVTVAAEVAAALQAPLDLLIVRKVGVPMQPELAMGAVVDGRQPIVVRNEEVIRLAGVTEAEFEAACAAEIAEIERRRRRYLAGRRRAAIEGQVVVVVDDGIATGASVRAALRALRSRGPKELVLAVPVAPPDARDMLRGDADAFICLETPPRFGAIGYFYDDFTQVSDEEVVATLARFPAGAAAQRDARRS